MGYPRQKLLAGLPVCAPYDGDAITRMLLDHK
jgi:hypothetical protein